MPKFRTKFIIFAIGSLGLFLTGQTALAACSVIIEYSGQENVSGVELCSKLQYPSIIRLIVYNPSTTLALTDLKKEEAPPAGMTWVPGSATVAGVRRGTAPTMASQTIAGSKLTITLNGTEGKTWA